MVIEKGIKVLYVRIQQAIYRFLCIALLLYQKLGTDLKNWGFELNPYVPFVAKNSKWIEYCSGMELRLFEYVPHRYF